MVTAPAGMILGAAFAILFWRGSEYLQIERKVEKAQIYLNIKKNALDDLERQLRSLPLDTTVDVRSQLWEEYFTSLKDYSNCVRNCTNIQLVNAPKLQLPEQKAF